MMMTPLRMKRLLMLAQIPSGNHKRWYSSYCELQRQGLTGWTFGMAFLTEEGVRRLSWLTAGKRSWPNDQRYASKCSVCKEIYFGPKRSITCWNHTEHQYELDLRPPSNDNS